MYESLHVAVKMYINYSFFTFITIIIQQLKMYWPVNGFNIQSVKN